MDYVGLDWHMSGNVDSLMYSHRKIGPTVVDYGNNVAYKTNKTPLLNDGYLM